MKIITGRTELASNFVNLAQAVTPAVMLSKRTKAEVHIVDGSQFGRPVIIQTFVNGKPVRNLTPAIIARLEILENLARPLPPVPKSNPRPPQYQRTPGSHFAF